MFSTALQGEKHLSGNTSGNVFFIFFISYNLIMLSEYLLSA